MPGIRSIANGRCGMTLVEVLAALVILGTLLVSVVVGRNRLLGQYDAAQRRSQAVAAADQLLGAWWKDPSRLLPHNGQGILDESAQMSWRTAVIAQSAAEQLGGQVVRLQILGHSARECRQHPAGVVLVSVEVLVSQ